MYKVIPNLTIEHGKRQMVFGALHTECQLWLNYKEIPKEKRGVKIPLVLMLLRWDGSIGFPGGNVDKGESLYDALGRELKEEINYKIDGDFAPLVSLSTSDANIHCFRCEITKTEMVETIRGATYAEHFLAETQGCFAVQVAEFEDNRGLSQFRRNNFKASALIEFDMLAKLLMESQ